VPGVAVESRPTAAPPPPGPACRPVVIPQGSRWHHPARSFNKLAATVSLENASLTAARAPQAATPQSRRRWALAIRPKAARGHSVQFPTPSGGRTARYRIGSVSGWPAKPRRSAPSSVARAKPASCP